MQRLAAGLAQRLPWLARDHIGALCRTLALLGLDETGWSVQDVLDLLDHRNTQLGLYSVPSDSQRDPLALFAHQLRAALADVDEPPRLRRARESAAKAAERAQLRAERAAEQARLDAERADPAVQTRIGELRQKMREQLNQARRAARYRR